MLITIKELLQFSWWVTKEFLIWIYEGLQFWKGDYK